MLFPLQKSIFIIDAMALRRASTESFLASWAKDQNIRISPHSLAEAHAKLVEGVDCDMLIYNAGGASPAASEVLAEMRVLHTLCPTAALVLFADDESTESVMSAIYSGVRGYLNSSMDPALALRAISLVLGGGTYFPPAAMLAGTVLGASVVERERQVSSRNPWHGQPPAAPPQRVSMSTAKYQGNLRQEQCPLFDHPLFDHKACVQLDNDSARVQNASAGTEISERRETPDPHLTARQLAVLTCLARGDSNKVVGRKLGMTETTVKVHVREIMRKLGVGNRTQIAIAAYQGGLANNPLDANPLKELRPPDVLATSKSAE
jgi:DNA-binding NarL/FixJ family response regulator